ncbi:MAG: carboxypeptidase regulatory-like domain-containing protein [Acidobacteriota bacterium]
MLNLASPSLVRLHDAPVLATARLSLILLFLATRTVTAQVTSTIQGQITDPSGAVIAGALVKVTNEATGVSRTSPSTGDGYYRVPDLLPGPYEIRVEQAGFKTLLRKGIELSAHSSLNVDLRLEIGEAAQTVEVTAEVSQIETTESRLSSVVNREQIQALPAIGRGLMWLSMTTPGVQGKAEDGRVGVCCDSLSSLASPAISSGGKELKAVFFLDGVAMHYGDHMSWNLAFTPNPDAVEEMRISTNPTSAEAGIISGPQVQIVTKGGTNTLHGTGHFTFLDDSFNALPYGASKDDVGPWYQRYFGGTIGGPIVKDRVFFFGAYEGLREQRATPGGSNQIVETEEFKDWVTRARPDSVAASILKSDPPFRYATDNLVDVNGDGIMDLGTVALDRPAPRTGNQFNGRVDYLNKSGKDRFYGSFWRSLPDQLVRDVRPTMDYTQTTGSNRVSAAHSHTFTPNSLNEFRFATWDFTWDWRFIKDRYNIPCVSTDDGISFPSTYSGACSYNFENFHARAWDVADTYSWNHGKQSWKFGGNYRTAYMTDLVYLNGDTPAYNFATAIDFANDSPYLETRNVDASTGKQRNPFVEAWNRQISFFAQNSWQVRHGLTLNLGLRWDYHYPHPIDGIQKPRDTYGPEFTNAQVNPQGVIQIRNRKLQLSHKGDKKAFGPRISIAWDPTGSGRTVIRGGVFTLYDEIGSYNLYQQYYGNPPISSVLNAGPDYGIPIVYGVAPEGTRDFPINPGLVSPSIDPDLGIFVGTRPALAGWVQDWSQPRVTDVNAAFQRQLLDNLAVTVAYHHRRASNDVFSFNANRFSGDLTDGLLDRLNPHYGSINTVVNWGRRTYHGLVLDVSKRWSQGWQLDTSYSYHNARSNAGGTEVFHPELDWAREEPSTHNIKMNAIWDLPFLRGRRDVVGSLLGGWQLATIWNLESGSYFNPTTGARYGAGGDFNADGQRSDRPDRPTTNVLRSYSHDEWMRGAISASIFPLPDPGTVRNGTLPRNYFVGPGYVRIDASLAKKFAIKESVTIQLQVQTSNFLNQVNISGVSSSLTSTSFGRATDFYPMRAVQIGLKAIF